MKLVKFVDEKLKLNKGMIGGYSEAYLQLKYKFIMKSVLLKFLSLNN